MEYTEVLVHADLFVYCADVLVELPIEFGEHLVWVLHYDIYDKLRCLISQGNHYCTHMLFKCLVYQFFALSNVQEGLVGKAWSNITGYL